MATFLYTYDPLDRLIQTAGIRRFYNRSRMTTEIEGAVQRSVFQVGDHVLAEGGAGGSSLLATDLQRSVLHTVNPDKTQPIAYSVYGHRPAESSVASVLGFNGERADPVTGHYLLGNGYRAFNPVLIRFNSPDSWSPFGKGGINAYAYCLGDPINRIDPDGNISVLMLNRAFTIITQRLAKKPPRTWVFANSLDAIPENKAVTSFTTRIDKSQLELTKDLRIFPRSQKQNLKLHTFIRKNKPLLVEFVESNNLDRKREIVLQLTAKKTKQERKLTLNIPPSPDNPTVKTEGLASSIRQ